MENPDTVDDVFANFVSGTINGNVTVSGNISIGSAKMNKVKISSGSSTTGITVTGNADIDTLEGIGASGNIEMKAGKAKNIIAGSHIIIRKGAEEDRISLNRTQCIVKIEENLQNLTALDREQLAMGGMDFLEITVPEDTTKLEKTETLIPSEKQQELKRQRYLFNWTVFSIKEGRGLETKGRTQKVFCPLF